MTLGSEEFYSGIFGDFNSTYTKEKVAIVHVKRISPALRERG
jgi:hypothetical protein